LWNPAAKNNEELSSISLAGSIAVALTGNPVANAGNLLYLKLTSELNVITLSNAYILAVEYRISQRFYSAPEQPNTIS